ncbi:MAG TPA: hypothetical protein VFV63_08300 [Ilumatobacteraceae bacterium]|nr:hypothetical protein [Ilumatobacteraceae bacterium]
MNTDGYQPLRAPVNGNVYEFSRADARLVFKHTVASIPDRVEALGRLCEANGFSNDPEGWTRMLSEAECEADDPGELTPLWRSIVLDVSLAMSDALIRRSDGQLHWKFYFGSKNSFDFHHPVIVGFQNVANKSYHVELYRLITNMTRVAANGKPMRDLGEYLDFMAAKI